MDKKKDKIEMFDKNGKSRWFYSLKNKLNDLTWKEWIYWSKSVINKPYPLNYQHKLRSQHWWQKPPELCADLIKIFTKKWQIVFDPFAWVWGTLIGASISKREAIWIELNKKWIDIYKEVCKLEWLKEQKIILWDSNEKIEKLITKQTKVDFILTDIPYWNMDKLEKSKWKFKKVWELSKNKKNSKLNKFNDKDQSKNEWLFEMEKILKKSKKILKNWWYIAVFIWDMYRDWEYHNLSGDLFNLLKQIWFIPKANLIWYDVSKSLHIYWYLYQFIPSLIHQNILIFRNE